MLVVFDHTPAFEGGPFLMLSERSSVDIHALKRQGFTISEIARRTNHDRKTIRAYLSGERQPGVRKPAGPDTFAPFVDYVTARLTEDTHLWAATLLDELVPLGYSGAYQSLTRQIRARGLRPACTACAHVTKRPNAIIEHPPGEETQFDWLELPDPPAHWGFPTKRAYLLVGSLAHSGVWRAVLSPSMDVPHLLAAMTTLLAALGGLTRVWRFDRMATVLNPATRDLTPMFAGFAKHHGIQPVVCRPRSGNRKGVVEKNNHTAAQRWWRTLADDLTLEQAQASVDAFARGQDERPRQTETGKTTAKVMFAAERLRTLPPIVFPVVVSEERTATRQALIDWRGNRYSVPPELAAAKVLVRQRLGADVIDIATPSGAVVARHRVAEPGLGVTIRDTGHVTALEAIALASAPPGRPHRRKERIPPGPAALRAAQVLTGTGQPVSTVISLAAYEQAAKNRNTLR
jgi:transposase